MAAAALGKRGKRVPLEPLLHVVLYDEEKQVREEMARALGELGTLVPVEPFLTALHDERVSVRAAAADVLGELGTRTPLEPLLLALDDHDPAVRSMVIWALGEQGENFRVAEAVIQALGELGGPIDPLVTILNDSPSFRSESAARVLGRLGVFEPLVTALDNENDFIRRAAVLGLGESKDPGSFKFVVAALGDSAKEVRNEALRQAHPDALLALIPEAIAILQGSAPGTILGSMLQGVIAEAIGNLGFSSPALLEKVTQLLDWPYWEVRVEAAQALGKLRRNIPDTAIRCLLELRHDQQSRAVCAAANDALAEILSLETGIEDD